MANLRPAPQRSRYNGNNESWKATAFLNIYVPSQDGGRKKIGFIALKESRNTDRQLIDFLSADPGNLEKLTQRLELEFNLADGDDSNGLALE